MADTQPTNSTPVVQRCRHCQAPFTGRKRRFCSSRCCYLARYTQQLFPAECSQCGRAFEGKRPGVRFCSLSCSARGNHACKPRRANSTCQHCGREYRPKASNRRTYCSRGCSVAAAKVKAEQRQSLRQKESVVNRQRVCVVCGKEFVAKLNGVAKLCSQECGKEYFAQSRNQKYRAYVKQELRKLKPFLCLWCDRVVDPATLTNLKRARTRKYCSYRCCARSCKQVRMARLRGATGTITSISPKAVFRRDKWICAICGQKTNRKAHWLAPDYPTLDHVIPLEKGGHHDMENVQCAHRMCNSIKGDGMPNSLF